MNLLTDEKHSYIYFVESGFLYNINPYRFEGDFKTVSDLINIPVKSWKPCHVVRASDITHSENKATVDSWFVCPRNTKYSLPAYLGVKRFDS